MQGRLSDHLNRFREEAEKHVNNIKGEAEKHVNTLQLKVRTAVSKDKFRFQDGAFDLDASYITNRIIAMGFPGSNFEKAWRNSKEDVAAFLQTYHNGHYMILNVSERAYAPELFQRVEYFGWPDHHPPSLFLLLKCVQSMDAWLNADPQNVIAVHCMAGRGRTGTVIAAYLLYIKMFSTAEDALAFFASRRSATGEGVQVPSQRRYVEYFQYVVNSSVSIPMVPQPKKLLLKCLIMRPVPGFDLNGDFTPSIIIENFTPSIPVILFNNQHLNLRTYHASSDSAIMVDTNNLVLQGDIMVRIFSEGMLPPFTDKPIFRFAFHTFFIQNYFYDLTKAQLDSGGAGYLRDERISPDFCVRLVFSEVS